MKTKVGCNVSASSPNAVNAIFIMTLVRVVTFSNFFLVHITAVAVRLDLKCFSDDVASLRYISSRVVCAKLDHCIATHQGLGSTVEEAASRRKIASGHGGPVNILQVLQHLFSPFSPL